MPDTTMEDYDMENSNNLRKILKEMPKKIKNFEEKIIYLENMKEEVIAKRRLIEIEAERFIRYEKEEILVEKKISKVGWSKEDKANYKPVFTKELKTKFKNEFEREEEKSKKLSNHVEYNKFQEEIDERIRVIDTLKIQLRYMIRINQNCGYLVMLNQNE